MVSPTVTDPLSLSDFSTLPLETLLGLPIEKMTDAQKSNYVDVLRAARTSVPAMKKHISASDEEKPKTKAKVEATKQTVAKLTSEYDV